VSAARLLDEAQAAGLQLRVEDGRVRISAAAAPSSELLARLRAHKAEIAALLRGDLCRHCGARTEWSRPGCVAFANGTASHLGCYEQAEAARLLAAGERAVAGVVARSDEGELITGAEP
jgi:hypothetical protein